MSTECILSTFISEELLGGVTIGIDDNLLIDGMVDSIGIMRLVAFIEEQFEFSVPPEDFIIENFQTVDVLSDYVRDRTPNNIKFGDN